MNTSPPQIKPETLDLIKKQADFFGLSVDDYLRQLLSQNESELALKSDAADHEFVEDMLAFGEGTDELPDRKSLYSREEIYFDHD